MQKKNQCLASTDKVAARFSAKIARMSTQLNPQTIVERLLACQPSGCSGAYAFKWSYLKEEILTKYCDDSLTDPKVRAEKAITKMITSEERCREINIHGFSSFDNDHAILHNAQRLIGEVLGDIATLGERMQNHFAFTSGATVCRTKAKGDPFYKYAPFDELTVTEKALPYAKLLIGSTPLWDARIKIVDGNVVFTVPKDSDIDRAACKEPALNQLLQSCVGSYIRKRLKRFGIDLNDQTRNQQMARRGSSTGRFATLDLKSASDSISQRCVFELLPPIWVKLLDDLRSPVGRTPDKKLVRWEKHSTMGNGYTFELESLIFWALTRSTIDVTRFLRHENYMRKNLPATLVSVYGDDIICPSHFYNSVVTTLTSVGFTVNEKKSFHEGPFRESCGGHFFNGYDVKPFYIRKPIDSPDRVIWLLNALRRWATDHDRWCDPSVFPLWLSLRRQFVPPEFLGGKNMESISEVVSPHRPRKSILWVLPSKPIDGRQAVLRWFQYNPTRATLDSIRINYAEPSEAERYIDRNDPNANTVVDFNSIVDLGSEEMLRVKRYIPSLENISLFPQEAVSDLAS
jgi:hypothetical protein